MEPERPVEKLLRAYAKKRAAEPGHKLDPVTRRLLQDEVKRRFPRSDKKASPPGIFLSLFSRKIAWALAAFLAIGLAAVLFMEPARHPARRDMTIARNEPLEQLKEEVALPPTSRSTPVPPPSLASAESASPMSSAKGSASLGRAKAEVDLAQSPTVQASPPLAQALPSVSKRAYSQQPVSPRQSEAPKPALNSFQVVQTGQEIKILDEDGSIYTGSIQLAASALPKDDRVSDASRPVTSLNRSTVALSRQAFDSSRQQNQSSRNYFLNVAGTNLTLNQALVFNGTLTEFSEMPVRPKLTNSAGFSWVNQTTSRFQQVSVLTNSIPVNNSRISGQLRLGGGQTIEVNALSPNP